MWTSHYGRELSHTSKHTSKSRQWITYGISQNSKTMNVTIRPTSEVSKLINNVSSTAPRFQIREAYTFDEVQLIAKEATQNLKTHLLKTLFINKLAPTY